MIWVCAYLAGAVVVFAVLISRRRRGEWWPQLLAGLIWPVMLVGLLQALVIGALFGRRRRADCGDCHCQDHPSAQEGTDRGEVAPDLSTWRRA